MLIEQCKGYVDATLPALVDELMLELWKIEIHYVRLQEDDLADCSLTPDYKIAVIRIDAEKIDDERALKSILYHELSHIILEPIEFYRSLKAQDNELEQKLWTNALENTVTHLERIFARKRE
jgi:hypothetical protein